MKDLIEDTIKAMEELEEVNKNSVPAEKKSEASSGNRRGTQMQGDRRREEHCIRSDRYRIFRYGCIPEV